VTLTRQSLHPEDVGCVNHWILASYHSTQPSRPRIFSIF